MMNLGMLLSGAVRASLLVGLVLAAMPLLRRSSSAVRRTALALGLGGALLVPALSAALPSWQVEAPIAAAPLVAGMNLAEGDEAPVASPTAGASSAIALENPARSLTWGEIAVALWALGAAAMLLRFTVSVLRSQAMVRRSTPAPAWAKVLAKAEANIGTRARVRMTRELETPAVTGIFRPVVLVPRASWAWTDDRRYATLLHELAHVKSADCLTQAIGELACAMHWMNPLVWLAARRLKTERELAADDAVVNAGTKASSYAEDLLAIAGAVQHAPKAPSAALGMAEGSELARRVTAIVSAHRPRAPLSSRSAMTLAAATGAVTLGVACASPQAVAPKGNEPAPTLSSSSAGPSSSRSTIVPALQAAADEELARTVAQWHGAAGVIVVLDPRTGEILANAGLSKGTKADVATTTAYITGSTMKAVTLVAALEEHAITKDETFDCGNGRMIYQGKEMHDPRPNGTLTVAEMLATSTNVGFTKVFDRLGGEKMGKWMHAFHIGAAPGNAPAKIERNFEGAETAIGEFVAASPLQMAAAYATIADGGVYIAPTSVKRSGPAPTEPLFDAETAKVVTSMLEGVVVGPKGTGGAARIDGVRVAGKTGTASWKRADGTEGIYSSFVGFAPAEAPRFVILVGVEQPSEGGYGGPVGGPPFARLMTRALRGS